MAKKKNNTTLGQDLIAGLEEVLAHKKGKMSLRSTTLIIPGPPQPLKVAEIKRVREKVLKMSQPVFAQYLGVSDKTVKAWEAGDNAPKGPALRLIRLALKDKEAFLKAASA